MSAISGDFQPHPSVRQPLVNFSHSSHSCILDGDLFMLLNYSAVETNLGWRLDVD